MAVASAFEFAARMFDEPAEPEQEFATPGELARAIDPHTIQTPALDLIDAALVDVEEGRCDRLIISMPPQEGKSTRVTKIGPLWALIRNPDRRIAVVSYGADLAETFGREIRQMITSNQGQDGTLDLGLRIAPDNGAVSSWQIAGKRGGVRSIGLAGGITGRPADWLFIDDPLSNREQAESERYRQRAKDFWTSTGSTRLAPGAPVVLILTRWHEQDLAGWLLGREDGHRWRVINIPAQADHDPNEGETDPLGREPGEYMQSARTNERTGEPRSDEEWEQIKIQAGSRDWEALYQGRPSPVEGGAFKRQWWDGEAGERRYSEAPWLVRRDGSHIVTHYDELIMSWDMAFKDTKSSDYVVGQVWMRRGAEAFLLDQVHDRMDFVTTCQQFRELAAKWPQAVLKLVEDKANGTAVINSLRLVVPGIVPEEPHGSKVARASAVSPLVEAGNVHLPIPELAPWVGGLIEEAAAFPNAANDDRVDALSQALNRLILAPLLAGQDLEEPDEFDELDTVGHAISPY
ncbi:phage terminase large subunit [Kribbella qitaiheensis]|uniref:phage terminase large subunit n=1 Tax=Kribbella qitaiheensis TaxID=1544730 RepID=UPI0036114DC3